ncbi:MAG: EamA family transporter RarD [Emergencia sp.]|nr:EamA family transporter RarD [Emergencia sp.]
MEKHNYKVGLISAIACAVVWGFLPIYWDSLKPIDSFVIIFYRVFLMGLVCYLVCAAKQGIKDVFKPMFESRKTAFTYMIAGVVITINWSIYIWAVNAGFVIQTSMGYFLEPLVVCLFGVIIYKEKINKWKGISIGFALAGLLIMIIGYHQIPLVAVSLGLSFAIYAAIKKSIHMNPIQSLLYETLIMVPIALCFIIYVETSGQGAMAAGGGFKFFLLMFAGIATAVPMGLFSFAAAKLPLVTLGLTEYISPSISLILGIFLFKEGFDMVQLSAFIVIWIGLVFFTYGEIRDNRNLPAETCIEEEHVEK